MPQQVVIKESPAFKPLPNLPEGISSFKGQQGTHLYIDPSIEEWRYNPARIKNRIKANHSYKTNEILPFPLHIISEVTSICDLKCSFCCRERMDREQKHMSLDTFKKIVREAAENDVHSISCYALGEPFLNKNLREMVLFAKRMGIKYVDVSTNAMHDMRSILGTGLNELIISIDGLRDTHNKMRKGANWDKIYKNVMDLVEAKKAGGHACPLLRFQCIRFEGTENDIEEYINFWKPYADVIYLKNIEAMSHVLGDANVDWHEIKSRAIDRPPCQQLYFVLTINADSTINYCCHSPGKDAVIGHLDKDTIKECWDRQMQMREDHRNGKYTKMCGACRDFWW